MVFGNAELNADKTHSYLGNFVPVSFHMNAGIHNDTEAPKAIDTTQVELLAERNVHTRAQYGILLELRMKVIVSRNFADRRLAVVGACVPSSSFLDSEGRERI